MQRLHDCALVKGELRQLHAQEGTAHIHLKCKFGNYQAAVTDTDTSGSRVEDEDIVREAEEQAAEGGSKSGGSEGEIDKEEDDWHLQVGRSLCGRDGAGRHSFSALTRQLEADADADSGSDDEEANAEVGAHDRILPRVCADEHFCQFL